MLRWWKMDRSLIFSVLVFVGLAHLAEGDRVRCLECNRLSKPQDCTKFVICDENEICVTEKYITDLGHTLYDIGCRLTSSCAATGYKARHRPLQSNQVLIGRKRQNIAAHLCIQCCDTDLCNKHLCGGIENGKLECVHCSGLLNMTYCTHLETCESNEVCYIEKKITDTFGQQYAAGCVKRSQCDAKYVSKRQTDNVVDLCYNCCNTSVCNIECHKDATPAVTTTTTTTAQTTTTITTTTASATTTPTKSAHTSTSTVKASPMPSTICPTFPPPASIQPPKILNNALASLGCSGQNDVVLLVDNSHSVNDKDAHHFEMFASVLAATFDIAPDKTRMGYTYFGQNISDLIHLKFGGKRDYLYSRLAHAETRYGTSGGKASLGEGLRHVDRAVFSSRQERQGAKKFLVILTKDNLDDMQTAVSEATALKNRGVEIVFIGIGNFKGLTGDLEKIVTSPNTTHMIIEDSVDDLHYSLEHIFVSRCQGQTPTVAPDPCAGPKLLNYLGCGAKEDIVLILDHSSSISDSDWKKMLEFTHKLVDNFNVSHDASDIGLMTFNDKLTDIVHLHAFKDKASLLHAIDTRLNKIHVNGGTFTHLALNQTLHWFRWDKRHDAVKVAIIFTDGGSDTKFETFSTAVDLHRDNVTVFVVGIGGEIDLYEQMILASDPDAEHMLNVGGYQNLIMYLDYLLAVRCRDATPAVTTTSTPATSTKTTTTTPTTTASATTTPTKSAHTSTSTVKASPMPSTICPTFPPPASIQPPKILNNALASLGCSGQNDVVLLVDNSHSVKDDDAHHFEMFASVLAATFDIAENKTRMGYTYFGQNISDLIHLKFGGKRDYLYFRLARAERRHGTSGGKASLGEGLRHVDRAVFSSRQERQGAKKFLVILTKDNLDDMQTAVSEATALKNRGVEIVFIGIGNFKGLTGDLEKIVTSPNTTHMIIEDSVDDLHYSLEHIFVSRCQGQTPTVAPDPCAGPKLLNYLGCGAKEDIVLILDHSGSINESDWKKMLEFTHRLVDSFNVSHDASDIGLMTFNDKLTDIVHLHAFKDKASLLHAIDTGLNKIHVKGDTFTHLALNQTLHWFQGDRRHGAVKVAIIFTDGGSDTKFETFSTAVDLHRNNVTVFVVGIGGEIDLYEQMILASDPDAEHMLNVGGYQNLIMYLDYLLAVRCRDMAMSSTTVSPSTTIKRH
ncbi:von Willebrand factor A domain-containing protein 2-like [Haliotis asinina]|uniref:von Willebrand factor A domain-containing protein 2-like n=1 Tax=Haliotis asinina TaxID=109174 RepID=UPI0035326041